MERGNPPIYTPPAPQPSLLAGPVPAGQQLQTTPGQVVAQQYVITINGNTTPGNLKRIRAINITANMQLTFAFMSVILGIVAILVGCYGSHAGMPIWAGICIFMVAGILGKVASHKKSSCSLIAYMVLSIIASIFAGILMTNRIDAAVAERHFHYDYLYLFDHAVIRSSVAAVVTIDLILCFIGLGEMVTAIVASSFCCKRTCCTPANPMQVQYSPAVPAGSAVAMPQGQTAILPQGQAVMNPGPQLPPYEAQAAPLPDKSTMGMQPVPIAYMPPPNQPMAQPAMAQPAMAQPSAPQASGGAPPTAERDSTGHNISLGDDQQPLVTY